MHGVFGNFVDLLLNGKTITLCYEKSRLDLFKAMGDRIADREYLLVRKNNKYVDVYDRLEPCKYEGDYKYKNFKIRKNYMFRDANKSYPWLYGNIEGDKNTSKIEISVKNSFVIRSTATFLLKNVMLTIILLITASSISGLEIVAITAPLFLTGLIIYEIRNLVSMIYKEMEEIKLFFIVSLNESIVNKMENNSIVYSPNNAPPSTRR